MYDETDKQARKARIYEYSLEVEYCAEEFSCIV